MVNDSPIARYIDLMGEILLREKKVNGEMWQAFLKTGLVRGGNLASLPIAEWVAEYLKKIEPKEVEVEAPSGGVRTMSMDDFKELIGGKDDIKR